MLLKHLDSTARRSSAASAPTSPSATSSTAGARGAKLRFFVSLLVEQEASDDAADNYGIRPLPNLETRFVTADALTGLGAGNGELRDDQIKKTEDALRRVRERHFNARTRRDKCALREEDGALGAELARDLERLLGFKHDDARAVARWAPYDQNPRTAWFDPEYMFGIVDGFDAVIGNPPYVRADFRDARHKETRGGYETLWEKWDLFVPFMERSFKLFREGGVSSLIVSDASGHAKYALKAREWFLHNALVERIDFFSRIKIFDAAVYNLSYLFRKAGSSGNEPLRRLHEPAFGEVKDLSTGNKMYFRPAADGAVLVGTGDHGDPIDDPDAMSCAVADDFVRRQGAQLASRMPGFAGAALADRWVGAYDITPDWNPVLGPIERIRGLTLAYGFSGHGFKLAPAVGLMLARTILGQETEIDIAPYRLDRFDTGARLTGAYGTGSIS